MTNSTNRVWITAK